MSRRSVSISIVLTFFLFLPAVAADHNSGLGAALAGGVANCDNCFDATVFSGFALFGKIGITRNWGVLVTYRDMEQRDDDLFSLFFNEKDTYTQLAVQGVYMWRASKTVRPHIKFGLERTDIEREIPGSPTVSDDGTGWSGGGGFEAGSQRVAFFLDYDITRVKLDLGAFSNGDYAFANLNAGIIFKF
jgi:hypothetical protein